MGIGSVRSLMAVEEDALGPVRGETAEVAPDDSLRYVSMSLRTTDDRELLVDLLSRAAGQQVGDRSVSARQFAALDRHRLLMLVPHSWHVDDDLDLASRHRAIAAAELRRRHTMRETVALLDAHGIELRVLKGLATAQLDYSQPAHRQTGDVDLLVRPEDFDGAVEALRGAGADLPRAAPGSELDKGVTLHIDRGQRVDLHWRLTQYSDQPPEVLFGRPAPLPDDSGLAMPADLRLVHAAAHLLYTPPGHRLLSGLADITAIRSRPEVDLDHARDVAIQLGMEGIVSAALRLEADLLARPTGELAAWQPPSRAERRAFVRVDRQLIAEHWLTVRSIEGRRRQARYLWHHATRPAELRGDATNYLSYLRRALPRRLGGQNLADPR